MTESHRQLRDMYKDFLTREGASLEGKISTAIADVRHSEAEQQQQQSDDNGAKKNLACPRLFLRMAELRAYDAQLPQRFRMDPLRHVRALETAAQDVAEQNEPGYDKTLGKIKVGISGPIGAKPASPRELTSASLRQLVCVEGVATKVSTIKPKVVKSSHFCPESGQFQDRAYVDATDPALGLPAVDNNGDELADRKVTITSTVYPTKDNEGRKLETEFGMSVFKDHQTITLQEMPEKAPMGQLPRSVELIFDHDLVDTVKPGDRVMVVGVYRALAMAAQGQQSSTGVFRTVVLVNSVQILSRDASHLNFDMNDVRMIRSLAKRKDILSVLGRSVSPSIHGHNVIKKAIALQLLSGLEKNLENGTHLRGDINILMVGDPSTAKSQLLRSAMMIAPLAVSTTGKGSSGVGLTAAVTSDPDTRERRLEAGAMVLADRGLVCVDEFDKMGENDRVAIHEAMEQQTVTIAKAGIHASLNARCSVLGAANPVYGQYDPKRRIQENIGLPDSLLSRFDLLFVVLDQLDPELDRRIATHVVRGHSYRSDQGQAGHDSDYDDDASDDEDFGEGDRTRVQSVWQRNRHHSSADGDDPNARDILQHEFLRKYIHFAKTRMQPILTESARDFIANRYAEMRARQDDRTLPVTARSLETVIRLATAHAKARLSETVEAEPDCETAMDILSFALYHENTNNVEGKIVPVVSDGGESDIGDDKERGDDGETEERPSQRRRLNNEGLVADPIEAFRKQIWDALEANDGQVSEDELADGSDAVMVEKALESLASDGRIMRSDGHIIQID